ncbi:hypothetical protein SAMN02745174_00300 [Cetobacterium ceti]|uniref:Uncharacterized protein n=1 Tax=Cetobacterium ceti TaxID=180163 RepID=A0A1T4K4M4_9FUSO|nr:hypothetical protein [Cetobacterium ceti]SJZ37384.1 hypothetical protein SAMN02745174_00300 [Cetobacterium ceti]
MRNQYLSSIQKAICNFKENIKKNNSFFLENITHLIAFIGLSKIEIYENSNIVNSCALFPNLKNLTLFCTNSSLNNTKNFNTNNNIKVNIIILEENISYKNLYTKVFSIIKNENFNNIFFDTTQGMKSISIVFYKLSIELGIKSLAWQTLQQIERNGILTRRVSDISIILLDNPKADNYKYFKLINELIDNYNFIVVSQLYKNLNNLEMALFFESLSIIFQDDSFSLKIFKKNILLFFEYFDKLSSNNKNRFKSVNYLFKFFFNKVINDFSTVNFSDLPLEGFSDFITDDDIEYLHAYLMIPYIQKKYSNIIFFKNLLQDLNISFYNINQTNLPLDPFKILNSFYIKRHIHIFYSPLNFTKYLKENINLTFQISPSLIIINNISINTANNQILKKYFKNDLKSYVLKALLSSSNRILTVENIISLINALYIKNVSKAFTNLEVAFKILNKELNNIFIEENLDYFNIIHYIPNKATRNINHSPKKQKIYINL